MRDKKFIINSIKMDLFRTVTATGNINKPIPIDSVNEFISHAIKDFDKTTLTNEENTLKTQLEGLRERLTSINDPHTRLRWAEDVMTIRCRL